MLSGGQYTTFDDPQTYNGTLATGINDRGQIVGIYYDASTGQQSGFVLSSGVYTTLVEPDEAPGAIIVSAINDAGQIAGAFSDGADMGHGFLATPAPA